MLKDKTADAFKHDLTSFNILLNFCRVDSVYQKLDTALERQLNLV